MCQAGEAGATAMPVSSAIGCGPSLGELARTNLLISELLNRRLGESAGLSKTVPELLMCVGILTADTNSVSGPTFHLQFRNRGGAAQSPIDLPPPAGGSAGQ